jgi:hypothetical protein
MHGSCMHSFHSLSSRQVRCNKKTKFKQLAMFSCRHQEGAEAPALLRYGHEEVLEDTRKETFQVCF